MEDAMTRRVRDVMTENPREVNVDETIISVARVMRDEDIGAVIVTDAGQIRGLVTDRDIVVRGVAEGLDPKLETIDTIYSGTELVTVDPDTPLDQAVELMRERAVRRLPVVENGKAVGIISIGDLAIALDKDSTLADISASAPNR
jgi:CBS domain-containing protein